MKRIFYCVCGAPMPSTSFKWQCEKGHMFNNPQYMAGTEDVMLATTESGVTVKFRSMISEENSDNTGALQRAMGLAETRKDGEIAPNQLEADYPPQDLKK